MSQRFALHALRCAAALLPLLAACTDRSQTLLPPPDDIPEAAAVLSVSCSAAVRSGSITCAAPDAPRESRQGGPRMLVVGGQGINVKLTSTNVTYDPVTGIFSADVTVQNLLPEALGTGDWITLDGVRVFFHGGPNTTSGTGSVQVNNPDGMDAFTGSIQPYFQYSDVLPPNGVSAPKRWEWKVDPGVTNFAFTLLVDADREGDDRGNGRFASISTGGVRACARTPGQQVYCWGSGMYGQVGSGEFATYDTPVPVAGGGSWSNVATGLHGTCGVKVGGDAWCWGRFTIQESVEPDPQDCEMGYTCRPGAVKGGLTFHQVSVGTHHTCGLTPTGEVWCWGYGGNGALGVDTPPDTCDVGGPVPCAVLPVKVQGDKRFNDIVGGERHTCGIERGGDAFCWGHNSYGQLGDGTRTAAASPVRVAGGVRFAQLDSYASTTCGLTPNGEAWCWGDNWHGQLGTGEESYTSSPVPVKVAQGNLHFRKLAVGFDHVCGLAITGDVWCWGGNTFGQLGDGTGGDVNLSFVPVAVSGGLTFRDLDAGHLFTCGVSREGDAWCWGHGIGQPGTPGVTGSYRCHYEPCSLTPARIRDPEA